MLRYNLKMQLLGELSLEEGRFQFSVGQRAFATLGAPVWKPSDEALAFLCNVGLEQDPTAAPLGCLAYGQRLLPHVPVRFSVGRLKGKRSFVCARAGYGKSNLIKYLVSQLYSSPPDVGLLIFDPEGECALPDAHGRPGLVNVPALRSRLSLYTNRRVPPEYAEFKKGSVHIDLGDFPPQDIVAAFIPAEKQEMVFANLLRSLHWDKWRELVKILDRDQFMAETNMLAKLLSYKPKQDDVSIGAVKNNLIPVIKRLHRENEPLGKQIIEELRQNRVVVVDVSLLGTEDSQAITGLLLRRIFQHNIRHLTDVEGPSVRCLTVLEEAQTMLGDRHLDDSNIFVRWVKEGRKYGLGVILVTQQPGAISPAIISQGDNFFVFHLLNDSDLQTLKRHNAYYSDEILHYLRAEPIVGNCYFWSAPHQPFVLPVRVANFETVCSTNAPSLSPARRSSQTDAAALDRLIFNAIRENPRIWIYLVETFDNEPLPDFVGFAVDYLRNVLVEQTGLKPEEAEKSIFTFLERCREGRLGYAPWKASHAVSGSCHAPNSKSATESVSGKFRSRCAAGFDPSLPDVNDSSLP